MNGTHMVLVWKNDAYCAWYTIIYRHDLGVKRQVEKKYGLLSACEHDQECIMIRCTADRLSIYTFYHNAKG